jgi:hypothetical protein
VIGKNDVDAAVALGQQSSETLDRVGPCDIEHFAANLCPTAREQPSGVRHARRIASREINRISGRKPLRQALGKKKAKITRSAGNDGNLIHILIDINLLMDVKCFHSADGSRAWKRALFTQRSVAPVKIHPTHERP